MTLCCANSLNRVRAREKRRNSVVEVKVSLAGKVMKPALQLLVAFAPVLLAGAWPFRRVSRGAPAGRWFLACWAMLVGWMAFFSLVVPLVASMIDRDLGKVVFTWVPEGPAVIAMLFFGWFYAGLVIGVAVIFRHWSAK